MLHNFAITFIIAFLDEINCEIASRNMWFQLREKVPCATFWQENLLV